LTREIYSLHIALTNFWDNSWLYIQRTIEEKLQEEAQHKCKTIATKLAKLTQTQTKTPKEKHTFHPRVINNTNITFNNNESSYGPGLVAFGLSTRKWVFCQGATMPPYAIGFVYFYFYPRLGIGWSVASHGWVREPQVGFPFR